MDDVVKDRKPIDALIPAARVDLYRREDAPPLAPRGIGRDLAAISAEAAFLQMIERAASDPEINIDKLKSLMELYERRDAALARKSFDAAVAAAKAEIPPIERNATGHNNKRYADFSAIAKVVDPILGKHDLYYRFRTHQADKISVTCVLSHKDGHSEETTLCGSPDGSGNKNGIQALGSTLTYLQRYSLVQMLGLASDKDDDGLKSGMGGAISDEQLADLREALFAIKGDDAKFCQLFKIENLSDLPASKYKEAIDTIRSVGAKKAKNGEVR